MPSRGGAVSSLPQSITSGETTRTARRRSASPVSTATPSPSAAFGRRGSLRMARPRRPSRRSRRKPTGACRDSGPHAGDHRERDWPHWLGEAEGDPVPFYVPHPRTSCGSGRWVKAVGNFRNDGPEHLCRLSPSFFDQVARAAPFARFRCKGRLRRLLETATSTRGYPNRGSGFAIRQAVQWHHRAPLNALRAGHSLCRDVRGPINGHC